MGYLLKVTQSKSEHYDYRAFHLTRLMGEKQVNSLRLDDVTDYIKARLAEHGQPKPKEQPHHKQQFEKVSRHTVHKELTTLGRALRLSRKAGFFVGHVEDLMPDDFDKGYKPRERYLTPDEFERLLLVLQPGWQIWTAIACYLGARSSEVEGLHWEHIQWPERLVHLHGTKTEESDRVVPVPQQLVEILIPLRTYEVLDELKRSTGEIRLSEGAIVPAWSNDSRDLRQACKRAGIARVSPNDMRRTFASWLAQGNQSTLRIAKLLGHTTTRMAEQVYARLSTQSLSEAIKALPQRKAPAT